MWRVFVKQQLLFLCLVFALPASATHIVGGELFYTYLGNNKYRVTLKLYRDCFGSSVPFSGTGEGSAYFDVLDKNKEKLFSFPLGEPVISKVPPSTNNPCIQSPNGICVEEGVYTTTVTLPPKSGGYFLEYKTCCRNASILNLVAPTGQGATYRSYIPGPETAWPNSSPRFKKYPTIFVCIGQEINFDHSAMDLDGDYLEYSLGPSYNGFPDSLVTYKSPYSGNYPLASNPAITIHPQTGVISGVPNLTGQWVVCVRVKEYRNGKLLSTHYRDFQFNVISCSVFINAQIANQPKKCEGSTISFTNLTVSNFGVNYLWDFGVPNSTMDTSTQKNPVFTFPDTGSYVVTLVVNPGLPCTQTIQKVFHVYPPFKPLYTRPASPQCFKNHLLTYSVGGQYQSNAQFTFNFGNQATPALSNQTLTQVAFNSAGWHHIQITGKQFACADTIKDSLYLIGRPTASLGLIPERMCAPYFVDFDNKSQSEYAASYTWSLSNGVVLTGANPSYLFEEPGIYSLHLSLVRGGFCADSSETFRDSLRVFPRPEASFSVSTNETSIFDPEIGIDNTSITPFTQIKYYFGDGNTSGYMNEKHTYSAPGTYTITQWMMNEFGCEDHTDQVIKIIPEFRCWVPNSFTPDGNGLNDLFYPVVIGMEDYEFSVFALNGEKVFSTKKPGEGWNGHFGGKKCPEGTYVWKLSYTNQLEGKAEVKTGHVFLLGAHIE